MKKPSVRFIPGGGGLGTPIYWLYGYVPLERVYGFQAI